MIANLFLRGAAGGNDMIRAFSARLILAMGYGLRQVPAEDRKTILEKGLRELWFLAMLVVQWWADKLPGAEAEVINKGLAPFSLRPLAENLNRVRDRLEPFVRATYDASSDANLAGAGVFFKALLEDVGADTLTTALRVLPLDAAQDKLLKELPPQSGLQAEFEKVLASTPAPPVVKPEPRGDRFERADLGTRKKPAPPEPSVRPPAAKMEAQEKTRSYFASLGWSGSDLDRIMGGPSGGAKS